MKNHPEGLQRHKIKVLDVLIDEISFDDAVEKILNLAIISKKPNNGKVVVTVNSEFVMFSRKDQKFKRILDNADLAVADGKWVAISRLILGGKTHERITGVDLVEKLCQKSAKKPIRIGFIGGFGSVAVEASNRQKRAYPGLKVVFASSGDPTIGSDSRLIRQLSRHGRVDIMFVAYGMGRQEFWIERMRKKTNIGVFIGVGGALDYLAKNKKRAPKVMQYFGIEWFWRLLNEPYRLWRMRVLPVFAILVIYQYFSQLFRKK